MEVFSERDPDGDGIPMEGDTNQNGVLDPGETGDDVGHELYGKHVKYYFNDEDDAQDALGNWYGRVCRIDNITDSYAYEITYYTAAGAIHPQTHTKVKRVLNPDGTLGDIIVTYTYYPDEANRLHTELLTAANQAGEIYFVYTWDDGRNVCTKQAYLDAAGTIHGNTYYYSYSNLEQAYGMMLPQADEDGNLYYEFLSYDGDNRVTSSRGWKYVEGTGFVQNTSYLYVWNDGDQRLEKYCYSDPNWTNLESTYYYSYSNLTQAYGMMLPQADGDGNLYYEFVSYDGNNRVTFSRGYKHTAGIGFTFNASYCTIYYGASNLIATKQKYSDPDATPGNLIETSGYFNDEDNRIAYKALEDPDEYGNIMYEYYNEDFDHDGDGTIEKDENYGRLYKSYGTDGKIFTYESYYRGNGLKAKVKEDDNGNISYLYYFYDAQDNLSGMRKIASNGDTFEYHRYDGSPENMRLEKAITDANYWFDWDRQWYNDSQRSVLWKEEGHSFYYQGQWVWSWGYIYSFASTADPWNPFDSVNWNTWGHVWPGSPQGLPELGYWPIEDVESPELPVAPLNAFNEPKVPKSQPPVAGDRGVLERMDVENSQNQEDGEDWTYTDELVIDSDTREFLSN